MVHDFIIISSSDIILSGPDLRKDRRARAMQEALKVLAEMEKSGNILDSPTKVYF